LPDEKEAKEPNQVGAVELFCEEGFNVFQVKNTESARKKREKRLNHQ